MRSDNLQRARITTLPLKTDKQILQQGGMVCKDDLEWLKACQEAWNGAEVYVIKRELTMLKVEDNSCDYIIAGWDEKDDEMDAKIREAFWQMEQDPVMGTYYKDRDGFIDAWREGEYEPAAGISFPETNIEILEETPEERFARMIKEHPGMRVVPMVKEEIVGGDECAYWAGSIGECRVREYTYGLDGIGETFSYGSMAKSMVEELMEDHGNITRQQAWARVNAARWKKALFVEIETPEMIEDCQEEIYEAMKGENDGTKRE